tara:strand:- start:510 stop:698 length:189 start_codon:yes stop_codon:yes gene_type:complete
MNKINPVVFKNKFTVEILPAETLLGIKTVSCEVLCQDDVYRPITGIEIGFVFFTFSYVNMSS